MSFISAIDTILQNVIVRWFLLAFCIGLLIIVTIQTVKVTALDLQLKAEKGQNAEYAAKLTTQNDAIKKAGDDMAVMQKQAETANAKAADLNKKLQQRKTAIREVILQGPCPDMVQQVLDEVRK